MVDDYFAAEAAGQSRLANLRSGPLTVSKVRPLSGDIIAMCNYSFISIAARMLLAALSGRIHRDVNRNLQARLPNFVIRIKANLHSHAMGNRLSN